VIDEAKQDMNRSIPTPSNERAPDVLEQIASDPDEHVLALCRPIREAEREKKTSCASGQKYAPHDA